MVGLLLIVLVALALRLYRLAEVPPGFFADEASIGYNAYSILTSARDEHGVFMPLFFKAFGEFKSLIQTYSTVPSIALFGLTEFATRLPAAIFGALTVPAVFTLAYHYLQPPAIGEIGTQRGVRVGGALLAGLVLALSPWHAHLSRVALEGLAAYVLALVIAVLLLEKTRRNLDLLPWFAIACGVGTYTYFPARLVMPLLFGIGILLVLFQLRRRWGIILGSSMLFGILLVPMAWHVFLGEGASRWGQVGIWTPGEAFPWATLWDNYAGHFTPEFLWVRGDHFGRNYIQGFGVMYRVEAPFIALGLLYALWRRHWAVLAWLFLLYPLPGTVTADGASNTRDLAGSALFPLLTSFGIYVVASLAGRMPTRLGPRSSPSRLSPGVPGEAVLALFTVAILVSGGRFAAEYFGPYSAREYALGFYGWQYGPEEIVQAFVRHQDDYDELLMEPAFNGPEIFLKFYAPEACSDCGVAWPSRETWQPERRQLFAARAETLRREGAQYTVRDRIRYPNGETAFLLIEITGFNSSP